MSLSSKSFKKSYTHPTPVNHFECRTLLSICLATTLFVAASFYPRLPSNEPFETQLDPLKMSAVTDCPTDFVRFSNFTYPPPNPKPTLDMKSTYPSSSKYPPLLGDASVVVQFDYELGSFTGSPSLVKLSDGTWISSFDVKVLSEISTAQAWVTEIWHSVDQGKTWSYKTTVKDLSWGSLFTVNGEVYLLGAGKSNTKIVISRMITVEEWTRTSIIIDNYIDIHTGNVGVLVTKDKVQTCIKNSRNRDVLVIYAFHQKDDLMNTWRVSNIATDKLRIHNNFVNSMFNLGVSLSEEPVMVPYGDKYAQVILRVNNDELCGLSERYIWDLETNRLTYLKLTVDPGWAVAHGFVIYDPISDFYWMISHYTRDNRRDLKDTSIYVPLSGRCAIDRTILGLYYGKNLGNSWHLAGFVAYSPDRSHHASYPFLVQDGDDLVFVARAHLGGPWNETTVNHGTRVCAPFPFENSDATANNHNSNMVIFNRITNFRKYIHPMMWYGQRMDNPWAN